MNYSIGIFAVLFLSMANLKQSEINLSSVKEPESVSVDLNLEEDQEKFKLKKNMVSINPIRGNYTVKVGQQLVYSASVHGSVGYSASASSSDESALPLKKSSIEYKNKRKSRMPGGDAATKHFIFDVLEVGTYEIITQKYFRGDLESEYTITITVTE